MIDEFFMNRCLELAAKGKGWVAPNPLVGSIVVHQGKVIGEGYHTTYGKPHAEVNAIQSVKNHRLLSEATLYVNLEPCNHFGKTPPCTNLIFEKKIPKVVIGAVDPHELVAGKGVERLRGNGVEVLTGVLEKSCLALNKHFYKVHQFNRPYVYAKLAISKHGFIGEIGGGPVLLSDSLTNQHSHKLRKEIDGIIVGKSTFINDLPSLTVRHLYGKSPKKFVICNGTDLDWLKKHDLSTWTIISFNPPNFKTKLDFIVLPKFNWTAILSQELLNRQVHSLMIEGGATTIEFFKMANYIDEFWMIQTPHPLNHGVQSPKFMQYNLVSKTTISTDELSIYQY